LSSIDTPAVWTVLKWVLVALAAGFVGQFGRSLALRIIERRRRNAVHKQVDPSMTSADDEERSKRPKVVEKMEKKGQDKI